MDNIHKVTPHAIIWLVGGRNVRKVGNDEYQIMPEAGGGVMLQHKVTGKVEEVAVFSGSRHRKYPESVKVCRLRVFPKWVSMDEFTLLSGETSKDLLENPGEDDKPIVKVAGLARFVL